MKHSNTFSTDIITSERYVSPSLTRFGEVIRPIPLFGIQMLIYNQIWQALLDGKLRPGTKLPEGQIGSIFRVSRTVVRKVLIVLEQEGIVTLPRNRGAYVSEASPAMVTSVFEIKKLFSCHIAKQLAGPDRQISLKDRERLEQHWQAQETASTSYNLKAIRRLGLEFPVLLATIYGNNYFTTMLDQTMSSVILTMMFDRKQLLDWPVRALQRAVLNEMFSDKPVQAANAMNEYLDRLESSILIGSSENGSDLKAILSEGL